MFLKNFIKQIKLFWSKKYNNGTLQKDFIQILNSKKKSK